MTYEEGLRQEFALLFKENIELDGGVWEEESGEDVLAKYGVTVKQI